MRLFALSVLSASLLLASCGTTVVNPVTGESERTVMDEEAEIAQGAKQHAAVLQEYGAYDNPALQAYVNALGQKLAAHSHRSNLQWHFTVLDSPEINAFALPGGYVYVTRGIMAYMDSEADLAGVMGHEIGHVTARHGAQRATKQQTAGLGVLAATILGAVLESQGVAGAGDLAGQVSQTAAAGYIASYGRDQELQADGLGAEYLARSNLNPHNMVDVIKVLKNQERFAADLARAEGRPVPAPNNWLASHPSNDQRLEKISALADQYPESNYEDDGHGRYLQAIQGMAFGDSAEQGLTRGRSFYHPPLGFALTAPEGWLVQNSTDQLALVNGARDAALVVRLVPAKAAADDAAVIRSLLQATEGSAQATAVNGLQATHFTGVRTDSQGVRQRVEATLVRGPGNHRYLLQWAAKDAAALQRARASLQTAQEGFRAMTPQDRQAAKPWNIKTVPYPAGGFAALAKSSPMPHPEKQLRLMNGYYEGGEPKVGQWVKVVE